MHAWLPPPAEGGLGGGGQRAEALDMDAIYNQRLDVEEVRRCVEEAGVLQPAA